MKLNKKNGIFKGVWKDIEGYEGLYQVSNLGQVRSLDRYVNAKGGKTALKKGKILKIRIGKDKYSNVNLSVNGKIKLVKIHRLVAQAFIQNQYNKPCVDHIDTNRVNNRVFNLRWVTHSENSNNELTRKHLSDANKGKTLSYETKQKIGKAERGHKHHNAKAIYCIELKRIWLCSVECAEELNINSKSIKCNCNGKYKSAGGYHFRWATQEEIEEYKFKLVS